MENIKEKCSSLFYWTHKGRVVAWLGVATLIACWFGASGCIDVADPNFVQDQYCQLNYGKKTEPDVLHDNFTEPCGSEIVLDFTPDQLRPYLLVPIWLQLIVSFFLVAAGPVALIGVWQTKASFIRHWLAVGIIWTVTLGIRMAALGHWGFTGHAQSLLIYFIPAVLLALPDVWYFTRCIIEPNASNKTNSATAQDFRDDRASNDPASPATELRVVTVA